MHADVVIIPQVLIYASNSTSSRKSLEYSAVLSMDNRYMDRLNLINIIFTPIVSNLGVGTVKGSQEKY